MQLSRRTLFTGALAAVPAALVVTGASAPANAATATGAAAGAGADAGGLASTGRPVVQDIQRQLIARYGGPHGLPRGRHRRTMDGCDAPGADPRAAARARSRGGRRERLVRPSDPEHAAGERPAARPGSDRRRHLVRAPPPGRARRQHHLGRPGRRDVLGGAERSAPAVPALRRPPETGRADFSTWASLLSSNGDPDRAGTAVDCITTITPRGPPPSRPTDTASSAAI